MFGSVAAAFVAGAVLSRRRVWALVPVAVLVLVALWRDLGVAIAAVVALEAGYLAGACVRAYRAGVTDAPGRRAERPGECRGGESER